MSWLTADLQQYFDSLQGFEAVLPSSRVQNKPLLLMIYDALSYEKELTQRDLGHVRLLIFLADRVVIPGLDNARNLVESEVFCNRSFPTFAQKEIRYSLEYIAFLLARHGHGKDTPLPLKQGVKIWRLVERFPEVEKGLIVDFVDWLHSKQFSHRSIASVLRELLKFKQWMSNVGIDSIKSVGNQEVMAYLEVRDNGNKLLSKQRSLSDLKPFFYYIKDKIDGSILVPSLTIRVLRPTGAETKANTQEIEALWDAVGNGCAEGQGALMLALVLGYGCTLKTLPQLQTTQEPELLEYESQGPVRLGSKTRTLNLQNAPPWLKKLLADHWVKGHLFKSPHGSKRDLPISPEYCQNQVKMLVKAILGYPIPVNRLERGALRLSARNRPLTEFMSLSQDLGKGRKSRFLLWVDAHRLGA